MTNPKNMTVITIMRWLRVHVWKWYWSNLDNPFSVNTPVKFGPSVTISRGFLELGRVLMTFWRDFTRNWLKFTNSALFYAGSVRLAREFAFTVHGTRVLWPNGIVDSREMRRFSRRSLTWMLWPWFARETFGNFRLIFSRKGFLYEVTYRGRWCQFPEGFMISHEWFSRFCENLLETVFVCSWILSDFSPLVSQISPLVLWISALASWKREFSPLSLFRESLVRLRFLSRQLGLFCLNFCPEAESLSFAIFAIFPSLNDL